MSPLPCVFSLAVLKPQFGNGIATRVGLASSLGILRRRVVWSGIFKIFFVKRSVLWCEAE